MMRGPPSLPPLPPPPTPRHWAAVQGRDWSHGVPLSLACVALSRHWQCRSVSAPGALRHNTNCRHGPTSATNKSLTLSLSLASRYFIWRDNPKTESPHDTSSIIRDAHVCVCVCVTRSTGTGLQVKQASCGPTVVRLPRTSTVVAP